MRIPEIYIGQLSATARDDVLIQKQHIYHLGDTVYNPNSSCIIIKLYDTSARGCDNNAGMQKTIISRFLLLTYPGHLAAVKNRRRRQIGNVECIVFRV